MKTNDGNQTSKRFRNLGISIVCAAVICALNSLSLQARDYKKNPLEQERFRPTYSTEKANHEIWKAFLNFNLSQEVIYLIVRQQEKNGTKNPIDEKIQSTVERQSVRKNMALVNTNY